jgi:peptidoglycan/LPS O-acetylase OafA/YrhL
MGGLVAVLIAGGIRNARFKYPALSCIALLGIGLIWIPAQSKQLLTVGFTVVAIASGYLVFYAATNSGSSEIVCRMLRSRLLRRLGKYSYGIYVLHLPIVRLLARSKDSILSRLHWLPGSAAHEAVTWFTILLGCLLSYATALLSWHLIEKRFLRLKDRFGYNIGHFESSQKAITEIATAGAIQEVN